MLAEGSETYEKWHKIPVPIYYRYYFFNVSNSADVERIGARPVVNEVGPFTYRSQWEKSPIHFHQNGTVSFKERKVLHFVPELSFASDTENILVTVNGPLTVTLALLQKAPLVVRNIVSLGLSTVTEGFFVKRSARKLLFEGYLEMLTSFGPLLNPSIPDTHGRFAWMYGKNNTDDGLFTVFTGKNNIKMINKIDRFNGLDELKYWKPKSECNRIRMCTDGQIIAINEDKTFDLFHPEMCRKIRFVPDDGFDQSTLKQHFESEIKFPVEQYVPDAHTLSSIEEYPPHSCYLSKITPSKPELGDLLVSMRQNNQNYTRYSIKPFSHTRDGRIYFKSGVFDMSVCKYGAPVLLSYPHFLHAHPSYRENIYGLSPNPDKHKFLMIVEPRTGTSLMSRARIQINIFITKPPWISRFRYIPEVVFPVFWQELSAQVPNSVVDNINWAQSVFIIADFISISIVLVGFCLVVKSLHLLLKDKSIKDSLKNDKVTKKNPKFQYF